MINWIKELFSPSPRLTLEEIYLSQSCSLEELERRQREISRGQAPWDKARMY